jgi:hypothetical protein
MSAPTQPLAESHVSARANSEGQTMSMVRETEKTNRTLLVVGGIIAIVVILVGAWLLTRAPATQDATAVNAANQAASAQSAADQSAVQAANASAAAAQQQAAVAGANNAQLAATAQSAQVAAQQANAAAHSAQNQAAPPASPQDAAAAGDTSSPG